MVTYFEFMAGELLCMGIDDEKPKSLIDPQTLGTIMYSFLNHL